jgi:hypothetical protein
VTPSALGAERSNVSGETIFANERDARPLMSRGVKIYFVVLFGLTLIALIPGAIVIGLLLFLLPGLILIASGTLLYYSIAALPGYFINRFFGNGLLAIAVAAVNIAVAAVLPHDIGKYLLDRLVAADHSDPPTSLQPRSFALPYPEGDNYWTNWRRPESHNTNPPPPCADLCQQLLFKGHVDAVVIRDHSDALADGTMVITGARAYRLGPNGSVREIPPIRPASDQRVLFKPQWRRFRLERRDTCPDTFSLIAGQFVHEVVGGRCLIEDTVERGDADVALSIVKPDHRDDSMWDATLSLVQTGPTTVTIAERRDDRAIPVEVKTALEAHYPTLPFYVGSRCGGRAEFLNFCFAIATDPFSNGVADPFVMIGRRYGFAIVPTRFATRLSVPVTEEDRTAAAAILDQDYGPNGYIPVTPSRLVASFVDARLKSGALEADDIALIRAVLAQHAFVLPLETKLSPSTVQALKPLVPDMFARIAYRADGQNDMVQSLDTILDRFSAADTDPYAPALCSDRKNAGLRVCYKREFRNTHRN